MGKLFYTQMMSLDGFMDTLEGTLDWVIIDEELHTFVNDQERPIAMYLEGRRMYETMVAYWPTAHLDTSQPACITDYARIWQSKEKVVFSRTLKQAEGGYRLASGDLIEEVKRLKASIPGDLNAGGAEVASQLIQAGLVDEYRIYIHPVLLGRGKPSFLAPDYRASLRLLENKVFGSGVVYMRYAVGK